MHASVASKRGLEQRVCTHEGNTSKERKIVSVLCTNDFEKPTSSAETKERWYDIRLEINATWHWLAMDVERRQTHFQHGRNVCWYRVQTGATWTELVQQCNLRSATGRSQRVLPVAERRQRCSPSSVHVAPVRTLFQVCVTGCYASFSSMPPNV